jgi:hypothetical protein
LGSRPLNDRERLAAYRAAAARLVPAAEPLSERLDALQLESGGEISLDSLRGAAAQVRIDSDRVLKALGLTGRVDRDVVGRLWSAYDTGVSAGTPDRWREQASASLGELNGAGMNLVTLDQLETAVVSLNAIIQRRCGNAVGAVEVTPAAAEATGSDAEKIAEEKMSPGAAANYDNPEKIDWRTWYLGRVVVWIPAQDRPRSKILTFSSPDLYREILPLIELGFLPQNIHVVERDAKAAAAIRKQRNADARFRGLHVHEGELAKLLSDHPDGKALRAERFNLFGLDFTGPDGADRDFIIQRLPVAERYVVMMNLLTARERRERQQAIVRNGYAADHLAAMGELIQNSPVWNWVPWDQMLGAVEEAFAQPVTPEALRRSRRQSFFLSLVSNLLETRPKDSHRARLLEEMRAEWRKATAHVTEPRPFIQVAHEQTQKAGEHVASFLEDRGVLERLNEGAFRPDAAYRRRNLVALIIKAYEALLFVEFRVVAADSHGYNSGANRAHSPYQSVMLSLESLEKKTDEVSKTRAFLLALARNAMHMPKPGSQGILMLVDSAGRLIRERYPEPAGVHLRLSRDGQILSTVKVNRFLTDLLHLHYDIAPTITLALKDALFTKK